MSAEHGSNSHEKVQLPTIEQHERVRSHEKETHEEALKPQDARAEVEKALESRKAPVAAEATSEGAKARTHHVVSPKQKERAYKQVMEEVQKELSPSSRAFSKFIHNPAVETTSEVIGATVARPTSILYGSVCAFLLLFGTYMLAKHNGFSLSGFEFIGLFAVGWLIGLLADFFRHMITGQR